jgi:hypothetical protein
MYLLSYFANWSIKKYDRVSQSDILPKSLYGTVSLLYEVYEITWSGKTSPQTQSCNFLRASSLTQKQQKSKLQARAADARVAQHTRVPRFLPVTNYLCDKDHRWLQAHCPPNSGTMKAEESRLERIRTRLTESDGLELGDDVQQIGIR